MCFSLESEALLAPEKDALVSPSLKVALGRVDRILASVRPRKRRPAPRFDPLTGLDRLRNDFFWPSQSFCRTLAQKRCVSDIWCVFSSSLNSSLCQRSRITFSNRIMLFHDVDISCSYWICAFFKDKRSWDYAFSRCKMLSLDVSPGLKLKNQDTCRGMLFFIISSSLIAMRKSLFSIRILTTYILWVFLFFEFRELLISQGALWRPELTKPCFLRSI